MNKEFPKELRLKSGSSILEYIRSFSITEKTVFGLLVITAGISAIMMAISVSDHFMTRIPANGGSLREGVVGLPHMINPVLAVTDVDRDLSALIYSGLMKYVDGKLVTDMAESYDVSDDGLVYSFKLRPDIYFHDGTALTSDDIAFTIQKVQNATLKSPRRADWDNISVEVVSPNEVKFILKQAYSPFISNATLGILPKHIWGNLSDDQFIFSEHNIKPIGTGPYKAKTLVRDSGGMPKEYKLVASNKYYARRTYLDSITFVFFTDMEKSIMALENGTIDSLSSVSSKQAKTLYEEGNHSVVTAPLPRIFGIFFNQNDNPVLADKNVRMALDTAIDRSAIINTALDGYGIAVNGPLPFGMNSEIPDDDLLKPDMDLARSILEKSGWTKNQTTGIYEKRNSKNVIQTLSFDLVTPDTSDLKITADLIKNSWNELGAKVETKIFEPSELYQNIIRPRKYDALLFGQLIGKERDLYAFWHSSQRNSPGLNVAMYVNSKADGVLETIRSSSEESVRTAKYSELDKIIKTDIPATFIYSPEFIYILPKTLRNNSTGMDMSNITIPSDRWNSIENWYMNTEKVWKIFANKTK